MSNPLAVIILAAGKGTRMKSTLPKVMQPLAGKPMISWLLDTVNELSPEKIVVVVGPDMKDLETAVAPHETAVQINRDGTAGAVRAALPALGGFQGDVLILLGDTPFISLPTLEKLIKTKPEKALAVLGARLENPAGYGRLIMDDDFVLQKIVEEKDAGEKEKAVRYANTGAFCVDAEKLKTWLAEIANDNAQQEYYITDLPEIAAKEGSQTKVCLTGQPAEILGCNTMNDLAVLEAMAQDILRYRMMESGVRLLDPASVYFYHDTRIAPGVMIEPHVFFGPGVMIETGVHIKAFSHIEGTVIREGCSIGPFARLRPGAVIGNHVRIGNFVEIKKSKIGERSKINHLAYVGDCDMGEDVNFGAGAITVNYDGFEKHKTHIGNAVMVGSNVNLVAPISIDDGAYIAAGSTIAKDVPADSLSIARDVGRIREGWAAEYRKRKKEIMDKLANKKKAG